MRTDRDQIKITQIFRESWNIYQKVIEHNYLCHRELKDVLIAHLKNARRLDCVLDLGCGDGALPMQLFSQPDIPCPKRFIGVDMSAEALCVANNARANFPEGCEVSFVEGDMAAFVRQSTDTFDVIMSTFAIHHLDKDAKSELLKSVYERLAPGGVLLWGDVYNNMPGSSLDDTRKRWQPKMINTYIELTPEEREKVWAHASTYDIPEDLPTIEALLKGAGYVDARCIFADEFYVAVWTARKPEAA